MAYSQSCHAGIFSRSLKILQTRYFMISRIWKIKLVASFSWWFELKNIFLSGLPMLFFLMLTKNVAHVSNHCGWDGWWSEARLHEMLIPGLPPSSSRPHPCPESCCSCRQTLLQSHSGLLWGVYFFPTLLYFRELCAELQSIMFAFSAYSACNLC